MRDISSVLLTIFGVMLFIFFLPTLLWIFLILILVVVGYIAYQKHKYTKYMNDYMEDVQQDHHSVNQNANPGDDIIDVEFSESEENES